VEANSQLVKTGGIRNVFLDNMTIALVLFWILKQDVYIVIRISVAALMAYIIDIFLVRCFLIYGK
jgi:hypothetical protein